MKKKILFFHFDLQGGGAEKVLINLLNRLDRQKYDISLIVIFGVGPNLNDVPSDIHYKCVFKKLFRGFTWIMKLLPPRFLHWLFIKGKYDLEVAYLESSVTRIISGCRNKDTKKIAWVHTTFSDITSRLKSYRSKQEAIKCYNQFDKIAFVSEQAKDVFVEKLPQVTTPKLVINNVNDIDRIKCLALDTCELEIEKKKVNIISVGRLISVKGFDRLLRVARQLLDNGVNDFNIYILGQGEEKQNLENQIMELSLDKNVHLLGFQRNPYRFISRMDLFVCSSHREGYSTAVSEAIALDVPTLTTDVSGMGEILNNGQFGMIVENSENGIYHGLYKILQDKSILESYKQEIKKYYNCSTQALVDNYELLFDSMMK